MKEKPEAVILRGEYDPYMKRWKVLAVYPEVPTRASWVACQSMYLNEHDTIWFGPFDVCSPTYYLKTRPLKDPRLIEKFKRALEERYEHEFRVMQKIVRR